MYVNGEGETLHRHMKSHWRMTHRIHTGPHSLHNPQQGSVTWVFLFCFVFVKEKTGFLRVWLQALMFLRNHSLTDTCRVATNNKGYGMLMFHLLPTKNQDAFLPGSQGHSLFEELTPRVWLGCAVMSPLWVRCWLLPLLWAKINLLRNQSPSEDHLVLHSGAAVEPRASHVLWKCSTSKLHPSPFLGSS